MLNQPANDAAATDEQSSAANARRVLVLSTFAFTLMFAVWLMFGILAIPLRDELGLTSLQFSWLAAIAILNGSLWRLSTGILTDRYGGRVVFTVLLLLTAVPTFMVSFAQSYLQLMVCAFFLGLAGNSFSVGISWNAAWFPARRQGFALGVFGAGNVGAAATKFIAPVAIALVPAAGFAGGLIPGGWRFVPFLYGVLLVLTAAALWYLSPRCDRMPGRGRPLRQMLQPLGSMRVWRFSLYYVAVFGAYVALSVWLPRYYQDVYGLSLASAAALTAIFIFPASLLRPLGGYLSDRLGARRVMYWVLGALTGSSLLLALPAMQLALPLLGETRVALNVWTFTALLLVVGIGMGLGKAAVYKYIPQYFPKDVGAVGGLVGLLGALGGFVLPPLFAYVERLTALPQSTFMILFLVMASSLLWLHLTVLRITRAAATATDIEATSAPVASGSLPVDADQYQAGAGVVR